MRSVKPRERDLKARDLDGEKAPPGTRDLKDSASPKGRPSGVKDPRVMSGVKDSRVM